MNEWLSRAIEFTGNFIRWMFLLLVAIGIILLILVMFYAVIKERMMKNRHDPFAVPDSIHKIPIPQKDNFICLCDKCGAEIKVQEALKDRTINMGRIGIITERFFECQICGENYTIAAIDREMRLMIQRRSQLMRKVNSMLKTGGSKKQIQKLLDEDEKLKNDLKCRSDRIKEVMKGNA